MAVPAPDNKRTDGFGGTVIGNDTLGAPQPVLVAVIFTVPDQPVAQDITPVTQSSVPAFALSVDQVTSTPF